MPVERADAVRMGGVAWAGRVVGYAQKDFLMIFYFRPPAMYRPGGVRRAPPHPAPLRCLIRAVRQQVKYFGFIERLPRNAGRPDIASCFRNLLKP